MKMVKAVAAVKDTSDGDSGNGSFEVILSTPTLDRDGEVVDAHAFDPLPEHIPFDVDHGMSVASTVGSGVPSYDEDGRLVVVGTYASTDLAQTVRTLVNEGHIRTTSVAFMAGQSEKGNDGALHITTGELLNGAFVAIPANRDALITNSKAVATAKVGRRNAATDQELIQQIHDLTIQLGASLSTDDEDDTDPADESGTIPENDEGAQDAPSGTVVSAASASAAAPQAAADEDAAKQTAYARRSRQRRSRSTRPAGDE